MKKIFTVLMLFFLAQNITYAQEVESEIGDEPESTLDPRSVIISDGEEEIEVLEKAELKFDSTGVSFEKVKEYSIIGTREPVEFSGDMQIADPRESAMSGSQANIYKTDQSELLFSQKGEKLDTESKKSRKNKKKKQCKKKKCEKKECDKHVDENKNVPAQQELTVKARKASPFVVGNIAELDKADLMFNMKSAMIQDNNLVIDVQYGGGCVKPHVFELVTDGVIDKDGVMDFKLLHKTHNDKCKALIMETLIFDFNPLYNLKSEKLKSFTVNEMRKMELK